ncbi:MAG: hypothetical protein HC940_07500 [Acaryochloris sp. SU_5_25]|nr:hypothetical protein [Acaryochloris sp. SU_5_25]
MEHLAVVVGQLPAELIQSLTTGQAEELGDPDSAVKQKIRFSTIATSPP